MRVLLWVAEVVVVCCVGFLLLGALIAFLATIAPLFGLGFAIVKVIGAI